MYVFMYVRYATFYVASDDTKEQGKPFLKVETNLKKTETSVL